MGTKITALGGFGAIDPTNDLLVAVDVSDTSMAATGTDKKLTAALLGGAMARGFFQARLTTESGVPVSSGDRTAQGTIYLTPIDAGLVRKWDGTVWTVQFLTEISLALTVTSGKNYDVFYNGSALSLSAAWTDDSTRADALALQDGVKCLASDHTKLYVGSLRASGANVTEDSGTNRLLYNEYNGVHRLAAHGDINSHSYTSATARSWNNDATVQISVMLGSAAAIPTSLSVGYRDTTAAFPFVLGQWDWTSGTSQPGPQMAMFLTGTFISSAASMDQLAAGYHYCRIVELSAFGVAGATFDNAAVRADLLI